MIISCLFSGHVDAQSSTETFESGTKTSYAAADVLLTTGWWFLDDSLIGNLSTDRKTGAASARVRNTGSPIRELITTVPSDAQNDERWFVIPSPEGR
jgi:hypothetical protein